ncbi:hypothetical protein [Xanthomonas axonopodis]|uniref:hypothetical protein n=1 Tax=Xanthomonas axonopodis TaxID=53413 RepID=UPI00111784A7|nr:hypothetical protein [Xanthomonas axonopodis]
MPLFSFGIMTLAFGLALPFLWYIGHLVRVINAYSKKQDPPSHRLGFYLPACLLLGLLVGSFAQPLWEKVLSCKQHGQKIGACLVIPEHSP